MAGLIVFNKPYQVLSQFSDKQGRRTLADYLSAPGYRVAGRLDYDSEGLLLLTDDGMLQQLIANPRHKRWKTYYVQLEGAICDDAVTKLKQGVQLKDGMTRPARAKKISPPTIPRREPAVRKRKHVPDSWIELSIAEGRNRQVRRMTAAVGFPTLRLMRVTVGEWSLEGLPAGAHRKLDVNMPVKTNKRAVAKTRSRIR
ncbi:MAG: pseudouridine synthase [Pseudomonadota bacterium]